MVWSTSRYALTNLSQFMSGSKLSWHHSFVFSAGRHVLLYLFVWWTGRHSNCKDT